MVVVVGGREDGSNHKDACVAKQDRITTCHDHTQGYQG